MLPNPRHWPWWGWALCVVATLGTMTLSAALIYRQTGIHLLRAEVARLHAAGYGVVPADLSQQLPLVDRARQNRAWALFGPTGPSWNEPKYPIAGMTEKKSISSASPESTRIERNLEIARNLDDSKTARSEWVTLSTEGPLVLTGLGWLTIVRSPISKQMRQTVSPLCCGYGNWPMHSPLNLGLQQIHDQL